MKIYIFVEIIMLINENHPIFALKNYNRSCFQRTPCCNFDFYLLINFHALHFSSIFPNSTSRTITPPAARMAAHI